MSHPTQAGEDPTKTIWSEKTGQTLLTLVVLSWPGRGARNNAPYVQYLSTHGGLLGLHGEENQLSRLVPIHLNCKSYKRSGGETNFSICYNLQSARKWFNAQSTLIQASESSSFLISSSISSGLLRSIANLRGWLSVFDFMVFENIWTTKKSITIYSNHKKSP